MSFNQYRTNPGQAVSKFKGRTDTPKAWPSTRVSTWMNGGLFGGDGINTWIILATADNGQWNGTGISAYATFSTNDSLGTDTNPGTQSDGSMMVSVESGYGNYNCIISVTSGGFIKPDSFRGPSTAAGAQNYFTYFAYDEASYDIVYSAATAMTTASNYPRNYAIRNMPGSNVSTSSTTINDLEIKDPQGNSWTSTKCLGVFLTDPANKKFAMIGSARDKYACVVFGELDASNNITFTQSNKYNSTEFNDYPFQYFDTKGPGYYWYAWGKYQNSGSGRTAVTRSEGSTPNINFGLTYYKSYTHTSSGDVFGTCSMGTDPSNGRDIYTLAHSAQMTGNIDFAVTRIAPSTGNVYFSRYFYGSGLSGQGLRNGQANLICRDSEGNTYVVMKRDNSSVSNYAERGELIVAKLNTSGVVQWIRMLSASSTTTYGGSQTHYGFKAPSGITISDDDNYVTVMGELNYPNETNRKLFMTRIPSDGSGYSPLSFAGGAINIGGTPAVEAGGSATFNGSDCYIRYYDNSDSSNWNLVQVDTLGGDWNNRGSVNNDTNTSFINRTNSSLSSSINAPSWYGNWPLKSWV